MIQFRFNEKKLTQIVAYFLKLNNCTINYTKLMKMLYLTDREALKMWRCTLSGDAYVSMPSGPVLSKTLKLIKNSGTQNDGQFWNGFITRQKFNVSLRGDPGVDELSKREIELIDKIYNQYNKYTYGIMIDITHSICPEWKSPGHSYEPITINDILKELNVEDEEIKRIDKEVESLNYVEELFSIAAK